jgi:hypothetical protein
MDKINNPDVAEVFNSYPEQIRAKLLVLRQLILDTATASKDVISVEETLKWGEPSYLAKSGSTIRIDWKPSNPDQYAMYFHCKTRLVDTFKELYRDKFQFEVNRAIVFNISDKIPVNELSYCILLSLTYHQRKHLPMLGA